MPTLGQNLRAARQSAGLGQFALGVKLGVPPTTISRWERDLHAPTVATLRRVAEALGVTTASLIGEQ